MAGRQFDPDEVKALLTERHIGPLEGFRSKEGRPFSAPVKLGVDGRPEFDFPPPVAENHDFSVLTPLHACTVCKKGEVYSTEADYVCNLAVGEEKVCTFKMKKTILQREIPTDQVIKMLETGRTDLLPRFISKKGRPFSAYLKLDSLGKVGFEFEPRTGKDGKPIPPKGKYAAAKSPAARRAAPRKKPKTPAS